MKKESVRVLMVCHGNICRSPMCEFIFKDMVKKAHLEDAFYVESRATHTDEIWNGQGSPVYPPARDILAEHGISCTGKRAQLLVKSEYDEYDYLVGMDEENLRYMSRICGQPGADREPLNRRGKKISLLMDYTDRPGSVADPWYTRNFEVTYRDAVEGCKALLEYIKEHDLNK